MRNASSSAARLRPQVRRPDSRRAARGAHALGVDEDVCRATTPASVLVGVPLAHGQDSSDPRKVIRWRRQQRLRGCGLCGEVAHAAVTVPLVLRARSCRSESMGSARESLANSVIGWLHPLRRHGDATRTPIPSSSPRWAAKAAACSPTGSSPPPRARLPASEHPPIPGVAQRTGATTY